MVFIVVMTIISSSSTSPWLPSLQMAAIIFNTCLDRRHCHHLDHLGQLLSALAVPHPAPDYVSARCFHFILFVSTIRSRSILIILALLTMPGLNPLTPALTRRLRILRPYCNLQLLPAATSSVARLLLLLHLRLTYTPNPVLPCSPLVPSNPYYTTSAKFHHTRNHFHTCSLPCSSFRWFTLFPPTCPRFLPSQNRS